MNIWSDDHISPSGPSSLSRPFAPSSFGGNESVLNGNILGSSNVSAGFLSSVHPPRPGIASRSVSDTRALQPPGSNQTSKPSSFNNARFSYEQPHFGGQQNQNQDVVLSGLGQLALSPSARALHTHAPGTSLPQGLAAGYSRMHARPNSIYSALSPPNSAGLEEGMQRSPYVPGITRVADRTLSSKQSAIAARRTQFTLSSPLAGPVISSDLDEDELFPIEIENEN